MRNTAQRLALGLLIVAVPALPVVLAQSAQPSGTYALDPAHASITFEIDHMGLVDIHGRFNKFEGTVTLGDDASASVSIDTASIDTGVPKRDDHLRSPDFFDARQFPQITFKSTKAEFDGGELKVTGDFTMHGVTKPLSLEFEVKGPKDMQGKQRIGLTAETTIKRSDFGVGAQGGVGDEVEIEIAVEAIKQ